MRRVRKMIDLEQLLPIMLYISLIILVIFLIALVIRLMKTLNRVDTILDDVNRKMIKVDGLFDIIDRTTDAASHVSDKIISGISNAINFVFRRKRGNEDDE